MTVSFEIKEIDNGFVVTCFDSEGTVANDVTMSVGDFDLVLDAITNWFKRVEKERKEATAK